LNDTRKGPGKGRGKKTTETEPEKTQKSKNATPARGNGVRGSQGKNWKNKEGEIEKGQP